MNPMILDLIVLALERGPGVVREVRDSFKGKDPTIEEIVAKMESMAPPYDYENGDDGSDDFPPYSDED